MCEYILYFGVNFGWDNEPWCSGKGCIYLYALLRCYCDWFMFTVWNCLKNIMFAHCLVFINVWNEWAEGVVFEFDICVGYVWLDAIRQVLLYIVEVVIRSG